MEKTGLKAEMMTLQAGKNERGMTFIEMALVIVILSVLLSVSWPVFSRLGRNTQLETTCKEISYLFAYARDYSLAEGKSYIIYFDVTAHKYWLSENITDIKNKKAAQPGNTAFREKTWPDSVFLREISGKKLAFSPDGTSDDFKVSFSNNYGDSRVLKFRGSTGRISITNN